METEYHLILSEAVKSIKKVSKSTRKYQCPYCGDRMDRNALVLHIEDEHSEQITDEFPAGRIVFNLVNKKETGRCLIDQKETKWNPETNRYNSYCCEKCKDRAAQIAHENCLKKTGKTPQQLLEDPERQNIMLSNRRISGSYSFSTGGTIKYVGSYEKKLLEFEDIVLHMSSLEIQSPGPVIEYEYDGKKHFWITDQYITAFNLAIDVKDGGSNPNTRDMPEYRAKQEAKEKAIAEQRQYNYLRLTDNDFSQLFVAFAEIKALYMNTTDTDETIIKINENAFSILDESTITEVQGTTSIHPIAGSGSDFYVTQMMNKDNKKITYGISSNLSLDNIYTDDDNGFIKTISLDELTENYIFSTYKFTKNELYKPNNNGKSLVEKCTGKTFLSDSQILYDKDFKRVTSIPESMKIEEECITGTILYKNDKKIPVLDEIFDGSNNLLLFKNENGYFLENVETNIRSKYFDKIDDIGYNVREVLNNISKIIV